MHQTRLQRFTSALKTFKREVIRGYNKYAGAFATHVVPGKESEDNPLKGAGLVLDGWLIDTHHLRWGIDAILECKVERDFLNENEYNETVA